MDLNTRASSEIEAALRERVKELTCLYEIARISGDPGTPLGDIIQNIVDVLPDAWQHPELTSARIVLKGTSYVSPAFSETETRQVEELILDGQSRGTVEVFYAGSPAEGSPTFLEQEQKLLKTVARQLELIVEQRRVHEERRCLHEQLGHADRLATIGQLAAGVAHELSEPLGNVLGLAELVRKAHNLPEKVAEDVAEMIALLLHTRQIVKKLLFFARRIPVQKMKVDLNAIVRESLYFLESRCASSGIEVVYDLSSGVTEILADPSQFQQVLVNLVVNAMQAMDHGGVIRITTRPGEGDIRLTVEDDGPGMSAEIRDRIFVPFFTTKDADYGTGLGLPVAHGIIASHGGTIEIDSETGRGTRFHIHLPNGE